MFFGKSVNKSIYLITYNDNFEVVPLNGYSSGYTSGKDYAFTIELPSYYEKGDNFTVKANGIPLTEVNGEYKITNITTNQVITIEGINKVKYKVEWELDGGYWVDETGVTEVEYGMLIVAPEVNKKGYTFVKWLDSKPTETSFLFEAVWKANTYTIAFDLNGGGGVSGIEYTIDDEVIDLTSVIPTFSNHEFLGWYDDAGNKVESVDTNVLEDIRLSAKWKHSYGEWEEVLESTYDTPGKKIRTCECGSVETQRLPVKNIAGILEGFLNDLFDFISSFFEQLTNIIDSLSANPDDEETKKQATEDLYDLYFE